MPTKKKKPAASRKSAPKRAARKPASKSSSKKAASSKSSRKPAAPKKRAPRKSTAHKGARTPVATRSWKRLLLVEGGVVAAGVAAGLTITGSLLWMRAKGDVTTYLADPPRTVPGVVWSAPVQILPGQHASVSSIAGDLLAAGYERTTALQPEKVGPDDAGQFRITTDGLEVYTQPMPGIPGGTTRLVVTDQRVVSGAPATFRPTVLATIGSWEGRRSAIDLDQTSPFLEPALLSMEDQRFRDHLGVDPWGLLRAVLHNVAGKGTPGGSTLTQQLAKNLFLSPERTLRRKVREVFFAAALESELDKDQLLELYLQEVYLGQLGGVPLQGVEAASRAWFGKSADNLELHEAAMVVGVIPAPNAFSPSRHPEKAVQRRDLVLDQMLRVGAITAEQADAAKSRPLAIVGALPGAIRRAPWAVDHTVDEVEAHVGEGALASRGYHVHTSIQPLLQRTAEEVVALTLRELAEQHPEMNDAQVALAAVRVSDGAIVAMVGSRNYAESPFNRAVSAWRHAGSTVKPLTLLAAFDRDKRLSPLSTIADEPLTRRIDGRNWTPKNYDGRFLGDITVREAIEKSRNIPAIKLAEQVGAHELQGFLREAGLSRATHLPSAALGGFETTPVELAGAYTAFPGGGNVKQPWLVRSIGEPDGTELITLQHHDEPLATARAASLASAVLQGVVERGTGRRARDYGVSGRVGGKTGTTDEGRDAWFVGYTDSLAVAVWVGKDRTNLGLGGSTAALPFWARFVEASGSMKPDESLPDGVVEVQICTDSHRVAREDCPTKYTEQVPEEEVPTKKCDVHGGPFVEAGQALGRLFSGKNRKKDAQAGD